MYLRNGVYWMTLATPVGATRRVSLETRNVATAEKVAAWAADVLDRLDRHGVLAAVVARDLTLPQAYVLGERDAAAYVASLHAAAADIEVTDAMLDGWRRWLLSRGRDDRSCIQYRRQVTTVWPAPRLVSWLTPKPIIAALDALTTGAETTKGRYRAALSSLCHWLVRQGHLAVNPMPSVPGYAQSAARTTWYRRDDALKVLGALPPEARAMEAVMWACGWEFAAIANATVADFDLTAMTALARGTKNAGRTRLTVITEPVVVEWLRHVLASKLPAAKVWPGVQSGGALKRHRRTCEAVGVAVSTLHDWRHSFAVKELQAGRSLTFVAQMLGHANTALVQKVYGRFALSDGEVRAVAEAVSQSHHNDGQTGHGVRMHGR